MAKPKINYVQVYREAEYAGWSWRIVATNGVTLGQSAASYATRKACIDNFELVTGRQVEIEYRDRVEGGWFMQGGAVHGQAPFDVQAAGLTRWHVEVIPWLT